MNGICDFIFWNCPTLTHVTIPASVGVIYTDVRPLFGHCKALECVVVDENNTTYDSRDNCNAIIETETNTLIAGCPSTIIPESVIKIGIYSFSCCTGLKGITIPDSVTEIEKFAFDYCRDLESVTIPVSVTNIGYGAFNNCPALKSVSILGPVKKLESTFSNCEALETVTLGAGIKTIDSAFFMCPALKVINVPAKKADYYKKRLPEELHHLIVELPPVKKAKK